MALPRGINFSLFCLACSMLVVIYSLYLHSTASSSTFEFPYFDVPIESTRNAPNSTSLERGPPVTESVSVQTKSFEKVIEQPSSPSANDDSLQPCIQQNSPEWLQGDRYGNHHEPLMTDEVVNSLMNPMLLLDNTAFYLDQTICHEDGRFRSYKRTHWDSTNLDLLRDWEFRLLYLSIHRYHHLPATKEWQARKECQSDDLKETYAIGKYDYECPNAKFLVTSIPDGGVGFRSGVVNHVFMALASGRIPLFLSNTKTVGPEFLRQPWLQASCDRHDVQCLYMPPTPCVLTEQDLATATVLSETQVRPLQESGFTDAKLQGTKVLIVESANVPTDLSGIEDGLRKIVFNLVRDMIQDWWNSVDDQKSAGVQEQHKTFLEAADRILTPDATRSDSGNGYYRYPLREFRISHAILFYLMRPNVRTRTTLHDSLKQVMPSTINAELTLGLSVQGSDRDCKDDTICLRFDQYMDIVKRTWRGRQSDSTRGTLVLTGEDDAILSQHLNYATNSSFPFGFVVNTPDVQHDTMISSLLATNMQLHAYHIVGNCCSDADLLIFDLMEEGCGASKSAAHQCLQETEDPQFHVCCKKSSKEECEAIEEERRRSQQSNKVAVAVESPQLNNGTAKEPAPYSAEGANVTIDVPPELQECVKLNTPDWLRGPRIGNNNEPSMTDDFVNSLMNPKLLENPSAYLDQTICHENGRFRSHEGVAWDSNNTALLRDWEFRLIYFAIHRFHHIAAFKEWDARKNCNGDKLKNTLSIGKYDYECPDAKFLVTSIPNLGMGASFRSGATAHIFMAMSTHRIPVFLSNTNVGPRFLKKPWPQASCDRRDAQCVYMPLTPCVLTEQALANGTVLDEQQARLIRNRGLLEKQYRSEKVLIVETKLNPINLKQVEESLRKTIASLARKLISVWWDDVKDQAANQEKHKTLAAAADRILAKDLPPPELGDDYYRYSFREFRVSHACLFYLMRPNLQSREIIQQTLDGAMPSTLNPEVTLGLPIRGSDKCDAESTCLMFDQYMDLMVQTWRKAFSNTTRGTIILTSEDKTVLPQRLKYEQDESFPFDFVVNTQDVQQGSGRPKHYGEIADSVMISSLVAAKMQLNAYHVVGNCCSNFHILLFDFLKEGCGAAKSVVPQCLQETEDPQFHVCCGWSSAEECEQIRANWKKEKQKFHQVRREIKAVLKKDKAKKT